MYYYYYYYGYKAKQVEITMRFHHENGSSAVNLDEFNEFIQVVNELHKRVIYLTQPEYKFPTEFKEFEKIPLLDYHELKIEHIQRENPFWLKLVFEASFGYENLYVTIWKLLLIFCKKYGKTLDELNKNTFEFWNYIKDFFPIEDKITKIEGQLSEVLGDVPDFSEKKEIEKSVSKILNTFFKDKRTKKYYRYFCMIFFTIDDLSVIFDNGEDHKLI
jgi:hypothetical protein